MVRVFVRHRVADYKAWRKVYESFEAQRRNMGASGHSVFQTIDDPNDLTVWHDFETLQLAKSFATSTVLKDAMAKAGVQGAPTVWFATPGH